MKWKAPTIGNSAATLSITTPAPRNSILSGRRSPAPPADGDSASATIGLLRPEYPRLCRQFRHPGGRHQRVGRVRPARPTSRWPAAPATSSSTDPGHGTKMPSGGQHLPRQMSAITLFPAVPAVGRRGVGRRTGLQPPHRVDNHQLLDPNVTPAAGRPGSISNHPISRCCRASTSPCRSPRPMCSAAALHSARQVYDFLGENAGSVTSASRHYPRTVQDRVCSTPFLWVRRDRSPPGRQPLFLQQQWADRDYVALTRPPASESCGEEKVQG